METSDTAILADCRGFLDATEANNIQPSTIEDDKLLLASHQLLAETEELLASCTPTTENQEDTGTAEHSSEGDSKPPFQKNQVSPENLREFQKAQGAKRRFRYRQKLKNEKEALIQHEIELSRELMKLQATVVERTRSEENTGNFTLGAWRAMAARQLERRVAAELVQKHLRAEVIGRSRLINQMNAMLYEQMQLNPLDKFMSCEMMESSGVRDGAALFKTMLSDAERLYTQTDNIFSNLEFKLSAPISYDLTRKWSQGVMYFDCADKMAIPYDFEQAAAVVSAVVMSAPETSCDSTKREDTITMKYHLKYQLSQEHNANFVIYGAARRYRQKYRLVVVWRGLTEGQGEFEGLQCDETTWLVLHPSSSSSSEQSSTVLRSYTRLVPVGLGSASRSHENIDRFVKTLAKSSKEEMKEMERMMEELIVLR